MRRFILSRRAPFILAIMAQMMMRPSAADRPDLRHPARGHPRGLHAQPRASGPHARGAAQGARACCRDRPDHAAARHGCGGCSASGRPARAACLTGVTARARVDTGPAAGHSSSSCNQDERIVPTLAATTDLLHLFGDPTRVRLLALLARHELTVAELTAILELAQSRVSTHLGRLREAGLLRDRRDGRLDLLRAERRRDAGGGARAVDAARRARSRTPCSTPTRARCEALLRARDEGARLARRRRGPDGAALLAGPHLGGDRARRSSGCCGWATCSTAASGDGAVAQLLAPRARTLTCLDRSPRVLGAARARLAARAERALPASASCTRFPSRDARFDQVLLLQRPRLARATRRGAGRRGARVLRPGGGLALVTLDAHAARRRRPRATATCTPGFKPAALQAAAGAGRARGRALRRHVARAPPAALPGRDRLRPQARARSRSRR